MKNIVIFYALALMTMVVSCEEILFEEDISKKQLVIIAPVDNATVESTSVNFRWEAVEGATNYNVQIARPDFSSAVQVVEDTTLSATRYAATLPPNRYEWKVIAANESSETAAAGGKFVVQESEGFSGRKVTLLQPDDKAIRNARQVSLQWSPVSGATVYRLQLRNASGELLTEEATNTTSVQVTFPEGTTTWQVRAENQTQNTLYTARTLVIDSQNPKQPVATAPANNVILNDTEVTFAWTRAAVPGTEEFDSIYIYKNSQLTELATKDKAVAPKEITLDAGQTYYWLLQAFDAAGNQSEASEVRRFTIN